MEILIGSLAIAILAAVVVPSFQQAGEAAKLAACRSNLYEIGRATHLYAADHDGRTPPAIDPSQILPVPAWGSYVRDRSFGFLLAQSQGGSGEADYIGRPHQLFCPSYPPELNHLGDFKHPDEISQQNPLFRIGYTYIHWPSDDRRSNANISEDPHRVLLFDLGANIFAVSPNVPPSHSSVINVLHLGGHVNTVSIDEVNAIDTGGRELSNFRALYDWMTEQSRTGSTNPVAGGDAQ